MSHTPRTDAIAGWIAVTPGRIKQLVDCSRTLKRENAALKAEVEREKANVQQMVEENDRLYRKISTLKSEHNEWMRGIKKELERLTDEKMRLERMAEHLTRKSAMPTPETAENERLEQQRNASDKRYLEQRLEVERLRALLREALNFPTHDIVAEDDLCKRIRAALGEGE